jgi:hypothetical protein
MSPSRFNGAALKRLCVSVCLSFWVTDRTRSQSDLRPPSFARVLNAPPANGGNAGRRRHLTLSNNGFLK